MIIANLRKHWGITNAYCKVLRGTVGFLYLQKESPSICNWYRARSQAWRAVLQRKPKGRRSFLLLFHLLLLPIPLASLVSLSLNRAPNFLEESRQCQSGPAKKAAVSHRVLASEFPLWAPSFPQPSQSPQFLPHQQDNVLEPPPRSKPFGQTWKLN